MEAFLDGFFDRIKAERLGRFSDFPLLFGVGAFTAAMLRKLKPKHSHQSNPITTIKNWAAYNKKTNARAVYLNYVIWPRRKKYVTYDELIKFGLDHGQITSATHARPNNPTRNKQWFETVETESADMRRKHRSAKGRPMYKRKPGA